MTDKAPYFFAAYALVWGAIAAYIGWLGTRVKALEKKLARESGAARSPAAGTEPTA